MVTFATPAVLVSQETGSPLLVTVTSAGLLTVISMDCSTVNSWLKGPTTLSANTEEPSSFTSTQEVPPSSTLTATTVCSGTTVVAAWVSAVLACVAGEVASVAESGVAAVDVA